MLMIQASTDKEASLETDPEVSAGSEHNSVGLYKNPTSSTYLTCAELITSWALDQVQGFGV